MTNTPIINDEPKKPSIWKQIGGALAGAFVALGIYGVYEFAVTSMPDTSVLTGYLGSAFSAAGLHFTDKTIDANSDQYRRQLARMEAQGVTVTSASSSRSSAFPRPTKSFYIPHSSSSSLAAAKLSSEAGSTSSISSSSSKAAVQALTQSASSMSSKHAKDQKLPSSGLATDLLMVATLGMALGLTPGLRRRILHV